MQNFLSTVSWISDISRPSLNSVSWYLIFNLKAYCRISRYQMNCLNVGQISFQFDWDPKQTQKWRLKWGLLKTASLILSLSCLEMLKSVRVNRLQALFDDEDLCSIFDLSDSGMDTSFTQTMDKQDDPSAKIDTRIIQLESSSSKSFEPRSISPSTKPIKVHCINQQISTRTERKVSNRSSSGSENFERDILKNSFEEEFTSREHSSESDQENMGSVYIGEPKTPSQAKTTIKNAFVNVTKSVKKNLKLRSANLKPNNSNLDLAWSKTLEDTLNNPRGLRMFQKFLERECSSENLFFWIDCRDLKKLQGSQFVRRVIEMYDIYFTEESQYELNIDTKMKLEVANSIIRKPTREIFDEVLDQIVELMRRDSFRRFQTEFQCQK